jgi:hypothetical protein
MWLMGSFASSSWERLFFAAPVICCAGTLLHLIRFRINVLSLGQEEAESLGMNVRRNRWLVLACTTLITAATVALAGIVGWVGLIVPHMARMLVGSDHRKLLPVSALLGASYLILMDDIARSLTAAEIPIGILTALAGAPLFAFLLKKTPEKRRCMDVITMKKEDSGTAEKTGYSQPLLSVGEGEILSILGPNGKGKTTLLKRSRSAPPPEGSMLRAEASIRAPDRGGLLRVHRSRYGGDGTEPSYRAVQLPRET